jgi:hypothetical protein
MGAATFLIVLPMLSRSDGLFAAFRIESVMDGLLLATSNGRLDHWLAGLAIYLTFMLSIAVTATLLARWAIQKDITVRG